MTFNINAIDGPIRSITFGTFTFEGLTSYAEEPSDWDYAVMNDDEVEGYKTYSILFQGDAFLNFNVAGATNLLVPIPDDLIVELETMHYGLNSSYIEETYPVGSLQPAGYDFGKHVYYYKKQTISSNGFSFDRYILMGNDAWLTTEEHYKITALTQILYRSDAKCFGVGTKINGTTNNTGIQLEATYTIFNEFLGTYGTWQNKAWAPHINGVEYGDTMFTDLPWNAGSYSMNSRVKEPYTITSAGSNLPQLPPADFKSGFYMVDTEIDGEPMIAIVGITKNTEGVIQKAAMWAVAREYFQAKEAPPYSGPTTDDSEGGAGTFTKHPGTGTLGDIRTKIQNFGTTTANFYGGFNKYVMAQTGMTPFHEFTQKLRSPSFLEGITNAFTSPLSSIICCHAIPHALAPASTGSHIIVCNETNMSETAASTFNTFATVSSDEIFTTLNLDEFYGSFLDYTGTSVYLHLPYIGVVQLDTTACMKGSISVMYGCDPLTGDVIAFVNVKDRENSQENRYTFKGNCSYQIPMATITPETVQSALSGFNFISRTVMGALTGGISGAVTANAAGVYRSSVQEGTKEATQFGGTLTSIDLADIHEGAAIDARNAATAGARSGALMGGIGGINTISSSLTVAAMGGAATVQSNGGAGSTTALPDTRCWVLITRPVQSNPQYYAAHNGYAADKARLIGDAQGLIATASVELADIPATDNERAEIAEMLREGVYVSDPYDASIPTGNITQ